MDGWILTTAVGQVGLGATVCGPITAHAGRAGIRLPASSFRTGATWAPALGGDGAALTGLQLHDSGLQLPVLGKARAGGGRFSSASLRDSFLMDCEMEKLRQDEKGS